MTITVYKQKTINKNFKKKIQKKFSEKQKNNLEKDFFFFKIMK